MQDEGCQDSSLSPFHKVTKPLNCECDFHELWPTGLSCDGLLKYASNLIKSCTLPRTGPEVGFLKNAIGLSKAIRVNNSPPE